MSEGEEGGEKGKVVDDCSIGNGRDPGKGRE